MNYFWISIFLILLLPARNLVAEEICKFKSKAQVFNEENKDIQLLNLMADMALVKESSLYFTEKKIMEFFDEPLVFTGRLRYQAPYLLEKHISTPEKESYVINNDTFIIQRAGKGTRTVAASQYPLLMALVESLRATLNGNLKGLAEYYEIRYTIESENWKLCLLPIQEPLQEVVAKIELFGINTLITRINLLEKDGDVAVMLISENPVNQ